MQLYAVISVSLFVVQNLNFVQKFLGVYIIYFLKIMSISFWKPYDAVFWGVRRPEPGSPRLLRGECPGFDGFQEQKTEAPERLTLYMFT